MKNRAGRKIYALHKLSVKKSEFFRKTLAKWKKV